MTLRMGTGIMLSFWGVACLASPLKNNEYLMFMHFPKSGGTTMQTILVDISKKLNTTMQLHYGDNYPRNTFDRLHPGHIAYGHKIVFDSLQPITPGRCVYYATMVRSPVTWALSLHMFQPLLCASVPLLFLALRYYFWRWRFGGSATI